ncbi:BON domain-containing protein [Bdellovibrio sp. 22V]|uniref:BON domain-containing protein n=1 Tax=Bdellovibrio TaxID=958 RepID=UPI002543CCFB|nr:BON domain-containing protein [Bdellovibrio sp. 22V]WII71547.1 BON domain-containing protein [Bdellovibrio sp. 22V]
MKVMTLMLALLLVPALGFAKGTSQTSQTGSTMNKASDEAASMEKDAMDSSRKTAMDQGKTEKDTALTRTIRERINADKSLSTRAKNITIITNNGKVLLKGTVASDQEQAKVEEIAKKTAGAQTVTNQTDVATE